MALDKESLQAEILAILEAGVLKQDNPEAARQAYAAELATAIDNYVRSASVVVKQGQTVQVSPTTGTGATSAPGTGSLN